MGMVGSIFGGQQPGTNPQIITSFGNLGNLGNILGSLGARVPPPTQSQPIPPQRTQQPTQSQPVQQPQ